LINHTIIPLIICYLCNKHKRHLTELLTIHASLLDHASLLEDFRKSVIPILNTANPAMDADGNDLEREKFRELLRKEYNTLLSEIETLEMEMGRKMQAMRLENAMNLVGLLNHDAGSMLDS
jgi:hypothetical protein